jgi:hypothetical protein
MNYKRNAIKINKERDVGAFLKIICGQGHSGRTLGKVVGVYCMQMNAHGSSK